MWWRLIVLVLAIVVIIIIIILQQFERSPVVNIHLISTNFFWTTFDGLSCLS